MIARLLNRFHLVLEFSYDKMWLMVAEILLDRTKSSPQWLGRYPQSLMQCRAALNAEPTIPMIKPAVVVIR